MQIRSVAHTSLEMARVLRQALDGIEFPFPAAASARAESKRQALARDLDQEIIPALVKAGAPALIGVVGPTGVGKSALANALARSAISAVSGLRPATSRPVLLAHPDAIVLHGDHRARAVSTPKLSSAAPANWAILDCGDPFAAGNDPLTAQPELAASAWLAVTSALRYGDGLVWDLLQSLAAQDAPVALVVNRVPEHAWPLIEADVRQRLAAKSLDGVELFSIPEAERAPQVLPEPSVAPLRRWLEDRFPVTPQTAARPDLRALLNRAAAGAAEVAQAQSVHQASVELLATATEALLEAGAEAAADFAPGPPPQALEEAWLDQIGPGGPLAGLDLAPDPERQARWASGLAPVGRAVSDAVAPAFRQLLTGARAEMARAWQGPDVPEGTRALLERRGLADAAVTEDLAGSAGYGLWVEGVAARLRRRHDPAVTRATAALRTAGLVALVQAAVLGLEGPAGLLGQLLGDQAEAVTEDGREALREARASSARLALAVFADAVREVERAASDKVTWSGDRLAYAAREVDE
ncbi:MAG: hypothetical protein LBD77_04605 [Bifidobacteriaceae bacterium]|jgi:hypothetical protein|nr:hypothetical protein [Bifidobacteriaceae bacterium]